MDEGINGVVTLALVLNFYYWNSVTLFRRSDFLGSSLGVQAGIAQSQQGTYSQCVPSVQLDCCLRPGNLSR